MKLFLQELRNCISRIIRVWSLFCLIRVSTSLHFRPILWKTSFCIFALSALCQFRCNLHKLSQQTFAGLEDVFKTSSRHAFKTSSTRLQRNHFTSSKTSSRRLENALKTSCKDVLKTSCKMSSRHL